MAALNETREYQITHAQCGADGRLRADALFDLFQRTTISASADKGVGSDYMVGLRRGWALVKYDLAGFLHWGFNHYCSGVDPFTQSVVPHGQGPPNYLPAGDSHVVYPGKDGPLSGQRFEAQRIGLEDAELLRLLAARDPARAQAIITRLFRAFDNYETDLAAYRAAKRDLLIALSRESDH